MRERKNIAQLSPAEITEIQRRARAKLGECRKSQDVIGTQVFSILSLFARVFYYPLGEDEPWGLTYMWGMAGETPPEKPFVAINTSVPLDAQVFAAAHELYHIWFDAKSEAIPSSILGDTDEAGNPLDARELKANRFAAEFLVDEDLLRQEMRIYKVPPKQVSLKDILTLSSLFVVPYKTMVKRLHEIAVLSQDDKEHFLSNTENHIAQLQKIYSLPMPAADKRIAIDNLVELAVAAYEQKKISYEKLQYLLSISNLEPQDIGITQPPVFTPPGDDVLDSIMEE